MHNKLEDMKQFQFGFGDVGINGANQVHELINNLEVLEITFGQDKTLVFWNIIHVLNLHLTRNKKNNGDVVER